MSRNKKTSNVLSLLGLLIAFLSFLVAVWAIIISNKANTRTIELTEKQIVLETDLRKSKLVLQIGRVEKQDKIKFEKYTVSNQEFSAIFKQKYKLIINNLGFQSASVISWLVYFKFSSNDSTRKDIGYGWYNGMGPWFYETDGKLIEPPLTIAPNQPKTLMVEVGIRVPNNAWNKVKSNIIFNKEYDYSYAEEIFTDNGFPFFGQLKLSEKSSNRKVYSIGNYYHDFLVILFKGDGSQVSANFSHSINSDLIQGEKE